MSAVAERLGVDPERLWAGSVLALLVALVGGSLLFPRIVYDGFVWHYFWGPVQADAHSAVCAIRQGGETVYLYSAAECRAAAEPVAYPGYTLVSEVGYVVTLLVALSGVVFLMRRIDVGTDRRFFYALFPFMLFGGALRVVEDAHNAIGGGGTLSTYPVNTLFISPIIYFTVFFLTVACLVIAVGLARRGPAGEYYRPLAGLGTAALALTLAYLSYLAAVEQAVTFYPQVLVVILAGSLLSTWGTWKLTQAYWPEVHAGTGKMGLVVLFAHAVDGVANVIGLDWMVALGAGGNLYPKHPVNRAIVNVTAAVLPASVTNLTGDAWPFLVVKLVAATLVLWIFEPEMLEESPRYSLLLLVAVVAVGLGPGSRDMLRATFGV